MKVLRKQFEKGGMGQIQLRAEEPEDMWHAYNLIAVGDSVRTTTVRKVVNESATGSTTSKRVRLNLTIKVERTDFDSEQCVLRLSGRNVEENAHVKIGAYHTLDLELNQNFSIEKLYWDSMHLERIEQASDPVKAAEVAAVVMTAGLAHVCLVTSCMTTTRARIEMNIPRTRAGSTDHAKAIKRFFDAVYRAILEKIDFSQIKCVLLGSPGFVKDDFFTYLCEQAIRQEDRPFIENKGKFVLCHASSGHKHAVEEIMSQPAVMARLEDTKAAAEVRALQQFFAMLKTDPDRAYYGLPHVTRACEESAIDMLLLTDSLFRSSTLEVRKKYVTLADDAKSTGAKVFVFSSMHISGTQLNQISGVAAILRFPMPDLEGDVDDSEGSDAEKAPPPVVVGGKFLRGEEAEQLAEKISAIDMGL